MTKQNCPALSYKNVVPYVDEKVFGKYPLKNEDFSKCIDLLVEITPQSTCQDDNDCTDGAVCSGEGTCHKARYSVAYVDGPVSTSGVQLPEMSAAVALTSITCKELAGVTGSDFLEVGDNGCYTRQRPLDPEVSADGLDYDDN